MQTRRLAVAEIASGTIIRRINSQVHVYELIIVPQYLVVLRKTICLRDVTSKKVSHKLIVQGHPRNSSPLLHVCMVSFVSIATLCLS